MSRQPARRRDRLLPLLAPLVLAVATAIVLLVVPTGRQESCFIGIGGETTCSSRSTTLPESEGWDVLVVLAVPVVIAGAPLLLGSTRLRRPALVVSSLLLLAFAALGAGSIGLFYLPAAVAMVIAAVLDARSG
jgi:hypothetical protein